MMENNFWNQRYGENEWVYGTAPNAFLKQHLANKQPGHILLPCEGEGRNAIYAAQLGWHVTAFDFSDTAVNKALQRAAQENVSIAYEVNTASAFRYQPIFDAIGIIYAHFAGKERQYFHQQIIESLKANGLLIMEVFSKRQLAYQSGGPKQVDLLYTIDDLRTDFKALQIHLLEEVEIDLHEGEFHRGKASVVRFLASKS